jgi:hypothetical protein
MSSYESLIRSFRAAAVVAGVGAVVLLVSPPAGRSASRVTAAPRPGETAPPTATRSPAPRPGQGLVTIEAAE